LENEWIKLRKNKTGTHITNFIYRGKEKKRMRRLGMIRMLVGGVFFVAEFAQRG